MATEPFDRGTGGWAEVFMPIAGRAGLGFDLAFEAREDAATLEIVSAGLRGEHPAQRRPSRIWVACSDAFSALSPRRGIFADVNIGVRAYWRFIVAPGGAGDVASG